jgi:hypothetical protein
MYEQGSPRVRSTSHSHGDQGDGRVQTVDAIEIEAQCAIFCHGEKSHIIVNNAWSSHGAETARAVESLRSARALREPASCESSKRAKRQKPTTGETGVIV